MTFEEYGTILYPYIANGNQLCYEVEVDGRIKEKIKHLPDLPEGEMWECFGVEPIYDDNGFLKSKVFVDVINDYSSM